jgi:hypothetical protein
MSKPTDLEKTWKPGPATTTTFNSPGNLQIPYGRYRGVVSGRGASGNAPNAATYNTNYNTNYNVAYPVGNRPIANQPAVAWNTNFYVAYPVESYQQGSPVSTGSYNPSSFALYFAQYIDCDQNVLDRYWVFFQSQIPAGQNPSYQSPIPECTWTTYVFQNWLSRYVYFEARTGLRNYSPATPTQAVMGCCSWNSDQYSPSPSNASSLTRQLAGSPGNLIYTFNYNIAYYVAYPIGSQPASAWNTNYNTNYNVAYPIANQPLANQPVATYNAATAGTPATLFGVPFPGGALSNTIGTPNPAPAVANTEFSYWSAADGTTVAVPVQPGGTVTVRLE